ncbi:hypothetical protein GF362_03260 [Candidatus Dojkabacteria bacterium]|nr:hypothetical protein [Candidatus Dojkabacteria bacterium]
MMQESLDNRKQTHVVEFNFDNLFEYIDEKSKDWLPKEGEIHSWSNYEKPGIGKTLLFALGSLLTVFAASAVVGAGWEFGEQTVEELFED